MHISEKIAAELIARGFVGSMTSGEYYYSKPVETGGAFGKTTLTIRMSANGRWLERIDGWHKVECCIDLRNYDDAKAAVAAVIEGS